MDIFLWYQKLFSKSWLPSSLINPNYPDYEQKYDPENFDEIEEPPPVHIFHPKPINAKAVSSHLELGCQFFCYNFCSRNYFKNFKIYSQLINPLLLGSLLVNLLLLKRLLRNNNVIYNVVNQNRFKLLEINGKIHQEVR